MHKKLISLITSGLLSLSILTGCRNEYVEYQEPQVQQKQVDENLNELYTKEISENKEIDEAYKLLKPVIDNSFYGQRHNIIKSEDGKTLILELHMDEYVAENGNIDEWNKYIYQCLNSAKALKELLVNNGLETNFAIAVMDFDEEVVYIYILNDQVYYNIRNAN